MYRLHNVYRFDTSCSWTRSHDLCRTEAIFACSWTRSHDLRRTEAIFTCSSTRSHDLRRTDAIFACSSTGSHDLRRTDAIFACSSTRSHDLRRTDAIFAYGVHDDLNLYTLCSLYMQSIGHLRHGLLNDICGWVMIGWQNHREMRSITRFDEERAVEPRTFCGPLLKRLFFD